MTFWSFWIYTPGPTTDNLSHSSGCAPTHHTNPHTLGTKSRPAGALTPSTHGHQLPLPHLATSRRPNFDVTVKSCEPPNVTACSPLWHLWGLSCCICLPMVEEHH